MEYSGLRRQPFTGLNGQRKYILAGGQGAGGVMGESAGWMISTVEIYQGCAVSKQRDFQKA